MDTNDVGQKWLWNRIVEIARSNMWEGEFNQEVFVEECLEEFTLIPHAGTAYLMNGDKLYSEANETTVVSQWEFWVVCENGMHIRQCFTDGDEPIRNGNGKWYLTPQRQEAPLAPLIVKP